MDQIVHTLTGYALSRHPRFREWVPRAGLWAILAANIPDADGFARVFGDRLSYIAVHRTLTHSLVGWLILPGLLALVPRPWRGPRKTFLVLMYLNWGLHIVQDVTTSYPTYLGWPLTWKPVHLDWQFILAPTLWLVGIFAVLGMVLWRSRAWSLAILFLVYQAFYFVHAGWTHEQALRAFSAPSGDSAVRLALPLPFRHDARMVVQRDPTRYLRWYRPAAEAPWQALSGLDLTVCPDPGAWKDRHRASRIFFRFADLWACVRLDHDPWVYYINARYYFTDGPVFTWWGRHIRRETLVFSLAVRFGSKSANPGTPHPEELRYAGMLLVRGRKVMNRIPPPQNGFHHE